MDIKTFYWLVRNPWTLIHYEEFLIEARKITCKYSSKLSRETVMSWPPFFRSMLE